MDRNTIAILGGFDEAAPRHYGLECARIFDEHDWQCVLSDKTEAAIAAEHTGLDHQLGHYKADLTKALELRNAFAHLDDVTEQIDAAVVIPPLFWATKGQTPKPKDLASAVTASITMTYDCLGKLVTRYQSQYEALSSEGAQRRANYSISIVIPRRKRPHKIEDITAITARGAITAMIRSLMAHEHPGYWRMNIIRPVEDRSASPSETEHTSSISDEDEDGALAHRIDDVGALAHFLATPSARNINAQVFDLDKGRTALSQIS